MDVQFFFDLDRLCLVNGINDPASPEKITLTQNDTTNVTITGVRKVQPSLTDEVDTLNYYREAALDFTLIKLAIGDIDAAPTGGTWKLDIAESSETAAVQFAYNATKYAIQTALNANAYIAALGGVYVIGANVTPALEVGAPNIHEIIWQNGLAPGTQTWQVTFNKLTPRCLPVVKGMDDSELGRITVVKLIQAPVAFSQDFAYPVPAAPVVASVRTGTGSTNAVQSYSFVSNSVSKCSLNFSGRHTTIFPVISDAPTIEAALNAMYDDGLTRFSVTKQSKTRYYIEFVGELALAAQTTITVTMAENVALQSARGTLDLNGLSLEIALAGRPTLTTTMELEITNGSQVTTPVQLPCVIKNDLIDGLSTMTDPDWVEAITNPLTSVEYDGASVYTGIESYVQTVGDGSATSFAVVHNLLTLNVDVSVRENGGTNAIIPDDQYDVVVTSNTTITVTFSSAPTTNQFVVMIVGVGAGGEHWTPHTHTSVQVTHDGTGLDEILDNLAILDSPLDLWPDIPIGKIPALSWDKLRGIGSPGTDTGPTVPLDMLPVQVALMDSTGHLADSAMPVDVLRYNSTTGVISYGVTTSTTSGGVTTTSTVQHDFFNTSTNTFSSEVIGGIVNQVATSNVVYQAIIQALQAGGSLPAGTTLLEIPDFEVTVPSVQEQRGPSIKVSQETDVTTTDGTAGTVTTSKQPLVQDQATTVPVYDYLSPACPLFESAGDISSLPSTPVPNERYHLTAAASSRTSGPRRGTTFASGSYVAYSNKHWYSVYTDGDTIYPLEMEHEFFRVTVTAKMLYELSEFILGFVVQAKLAGNVTGRGEIVLEAAPMNPPDQVTNRNLGDLTWTAIQKTVILLTPGTVFHNIGLNLQRAANTSGPTIHVSGNTVEYGQETAISGGTITACFATCNFTVRARFLRFDYEGTNDDARGALTLAVKGARATVAPTA
jgi:hypothetical protein